MANSKLSALTTIPAVDRAADLLYIVDTSGTSSNKTTPNQLLGITGAPVGDTDTATLTNKTITAPTISSPVLSGTVTGTYTLAGTPTFPAAVVTLTGSQTLTNKTLTSPTINTPTISNATITANAVAGFTTSNTGTIYGVAITAGVITGANSISTGTIIQGGVSGSQLSTSAITLGYAQITSNFATASTTAVQVTSLTATVTIPAGGRRIKITAHAGNIKGSTLCNVAISIWDGTVGSGTQLNSGTYTSGGVDYNIPATVIAVVSPAAGSKTYNIGLLSNPGTGTVVASATVPAFILVEAI